MDGPVSPVDLIEEWRRKASIFSSTDRLGNLISRSLEVLKGLARKELSFSDLEYALESLEMERTLALKHDKAKDTDEVRSLMYGVIESIGLSVNAMISNDRITKIEEATVEDPLISQMDTSRSSSAHREETFNIGVPSAAHQQAQLGKDKRRLEPGEIRGDSSIAHALSPIGQHERGSVVKRARVEERAGSQPHPHFAPAPSHFEFGDQYRLPVAPSSSSSDHHVKDEEDRPIFGEGVVIKEENLSPVELVEQQVYEPSQYTRWCHEYAGMQQQQPSTSHAGPTPHYTLPPIAYGHGMPGNQQDFANSMGASATAHMYETVYPGTSQAGSNKNESLHSPGRSNCSDDAPKPFACDECGKTFASSKWKQNHIRNAHSADKSKFTCNICGMKFTDRSNQRRHIRRQHELRCTVCEEKFDNKSLFEEHIWVAHGMRAPPIPQLPPPVMNNETN